MQLCFSPESCSLTPAGRWPLTSKSVLFVKVQARATQFKFKRGSDGTGRVSGTI
jgi:hypothetical protein